MGRNATIALPALPVSIIQMLQTVALNIAKTANIALDALTVFWETVLLVLAVRTVPCAFHVSKTPTWTFARCAKLPVKAVSVLPDVSLEPRPLLSSSSETMFSKLATNFQVTLGTEPKTTQRPNFDHEK